MAQVTLKGGPVELEGKLAQIGDTAPDFTLVGGDTSEISLKDFSGCIKVLLAVPSLDTPVCAQQTRVFHEKLGGMMEKVKTIVISGDLPFAMKRFCSTEGIDNVLTGSQYRDMNFSKSYGTHIKEGAIKGLSARAVFVVDKDDVVRYVELVPEISDEPNYEKALEAVQNLV